MNSLGQAILSEPLAIVYCGARPHSRPSCQPSLCPPACPPAALQHQLPPPFPPDSSSQPAHVFLHLSSPAHRHPSSIRILAPPRNLFASSRSQRHLCLFICSYTSFLFASFTSLPKTVALLPAAALAASKAPSDAASSEASSSSPFGCGCSARAPLPPRASLLSSQQAPPHIRRRPRARPQVERGPPKQKGQAKANAAKARTEFTHASRPSSRFPPRFSAPPGPEKGPCPPGTSQFCPSLFLTLCLAVPTTTAATAFTVCPSSVKGAVPKAQAQAQAQARPPARARTTRSSFLLLARRRPRPPKTPPEPKLTTTKRLVLSITTTPPAASIRPPRQLPPPPLPTPTQLAKAPGKCPSDSAWRAILANQ